MPAPKLSHLDDREHAASDLPASAVAAQADRILAGAGFRKAKRLARFLDYAVENTLAGREEVLKETVLGIEVFDRGPGFNPRLDAIVRIDARRLRSRLAEYYQTEGAGDPILKVGDNPAGAAFDGAHIWVTNYNDGTISKL